MQPQPLSETLVERLRDAEALVVLTGAGVSAESGLSTFRGPGGIWEGHEPTELATPQAFADDPLLVWRFYDWRRRQASAAEPNPGHLALSAMERSFPEFLLVTQNVDGLHERSGFPEDRIVNIHGSDRAVVCMACGSREDRAGAQQQWESGVAVPACGCGGPFKPATISFGQGLVEEDLERAFAAAGDCDLFVAVGTSLVVSPINRMAELALRAGAATAILTASETPFDGACDYKLGEPLERLLPELCDRILRGS